MAIKEQGFGEGVSLAQKGLNQIERIGKKFEQTGNEIDTYLDNENLQDQTLEARKLISDLHKNSNNNIKSFNDTAEVAKQDILKNARNGKIQAQLEREIDSQIFKYRNAMAAENEAGEKQLRVAKTNSYLESNKIDTVDKIANGDIQGAELNYDNDIKALDQLVENGDITEATAFLRKEKLNKDFRNEKITGSLNRILQPLQEAAEGGSIQDIQVITETETQLKNALNNPENNAEYFKQFGLEVRNGKIVEPKTGLEISDAEKKSLENDIELQIDNITNSFVNKQKQERQRIVGNTSVVIERMKNNMPTSPEQIAAIETEALQYFEAEQVNMIMEPLKEMVEIFKQPNFTNRNDFIKEQYKNNLVKQQKMLEYSTITYSNLIKDPIQGFKNGGDIPNDELNFTNGTRELIAGLDTRINKMKELKDKYSTPSDYFSSTEIKAVNEQWKVLPTPDKVEFLQYIASKGLDVTQVFETNVATKTASKSFKENGNSELVKDLSVAASYDPKDPKATQLMNELMDGKELSKIPELVSDKHKTTFMQYWYQKNSTLYGRNESTKMKNDAENAFAVYVSRANQAGINMTDEFNEGLLVNSDQEDLLDEIGVDTLGNRATIESGALEYDLLLSRNISPETAKKRMNGWNDETMGLINNPVGLSKAQIKEGILEKGLKLQATQIAEYNGYVYNVVDKYGKKIMGDDGKLYTLALEDITGQGVNFVEEQNDFVSNLFSTVKNTVSTRAETVMEKGLIDAIPELAQQDFETVKNISVEYIKQHKEDVTSLVTEDIPKFVDILNENTVEAGDKFIDFAANLVFGREAGKEKAAYIKQFQKENREEIANATKYAFETHNKFVLDTFEDISNFSPEGLQEAANIIDYTVSNIKKNVMIAKTEAKKFGFNIFDFGLVFDVDTNDLLDKITNHEFKFLNEKERMKMLNDFSNSVKKRLNNSKFKQYAEDVVEDTKGLYEDTKNELEELLKSLGEM